MLNRQEAAQAMLNERQEAVQAMFNRQPAAQTEAALNREQQLRNRLQWGKTIEDLTLAVSDYVYLTDEISLHGEHPYSFTHWEDRSIREFESNLLAARTHIDAALAVKLRFEKSLGEQQTVTEAAQEDGPQITEEQLRDRLEWGKKLEDLIIALNEFHEAEERLYGEGPHAFNRREAALLDEFNCEIAGAETKLSDLMAVKLRFEREHNL